MIYHGPATDFLSSLDSNSTQLLWTDPPFGTDNTQRLASTGKHYRDTSVDEVLSIMFDISSHIKRILTPDGVAAICMDYRAVHQTYGIFTAAGLVPRGEIIWTFGLGRGASKWWANKHNTILLFSKSDMLPRFHADRVPTTVRRVPKAGYEGDKKVASVWDYTLSNTARERVGYPNQKPEAIIEPFVLVHTDEGDLVVDPFGGSGSTAAVASRLNRRYATADINQVAIDTIRERLDVRTI